MVHKDYRKEVGVASGNKTVPKAVSLAVFALVAVAVSFSVLEVLKEAKRIHGEDKPAAAAPAATAAE